MSTYTSYNMPATVNAVRFSGGTSYSYTYTYGPEHERVKLVHSTLGTFIYLHPDGRGKLLYEKEVRPGGVVEHKSYINAGDINVAVIVKRSDGSNETRYFHQDHLGSIATITNSTGGVMERLAYDAYGHRRYPNGTSDTNNSLFGVSGDRGYTNHEHLDEVALIHMNGRVYDPTLARFITADPFVGQASNLQDYNRYSYVNNNPLMYTDPSGYFKLKSLWRPIVAVAAAYFTGYLDFSALAAGNGLSLMSSTTLAQSMAGGFAGGLVNGGGDFKAGLQGALTAGLFFGTTMITPDDFSRVLAHAAVGCGSSAAGGGSCGSGALSAGVAKFATQQLRGSALTSVGRGIAVTVIGGTASVIGGGKFENGAVTAAFGYLFNEISCASGASTCRGTNVTRAELNEHGRIGGGKSVAIPGGEVDLSYMRDEDFPLPGQRKGMAAPWKEIGSRYNADMIKFGSVTAQGLSADALQLLPQPHDFEFQNFQQGALRELFTFFGAVEATKGGTASFTPFQIIFDGPTRIPGQRRQGPMQQ